MIVRKYTETTINELSSLLTNLQLVEWDGTACGWTADNRSLIALYLASTLALKDVEKGFDTIMDLFVAHVRTLMVTPLIEGSDDYSDLLDIHCDTRPISERFLLIWLKRLGISGRRDLPEYIYRELDFRVGVNRTDPEYLNGYARMLIECLMELAVLEVQAREGELRPQIHRILGTKEF